jgi:hypothetical protein
LLLDEWERYNDNTPWLTNQSAVYKELERLVKSGEQPMARVTVDVLAFHASAA